MTTPLFVAACLTTGIAGAAFGTFYVWSRLRHRISLVANCAPFYLFILLNAGAAVVAFLLSGITPPAPGAAPHEVTKHFVTAAGFGLVLVSTSLVGIPKNPIRRDTEYVNIAGSLVRLVEESLNDVVHQREFELEVLATERGLTTNQLAAGLEKSIARRVEDAAKQRKEGAKVQAARNADDRLRLIGIALEYHSPRAIKRGLFDYCAKQPR